MTNVLFIVSAALVASCFVEAQAQDKPSVTEVNSAPHKVSPIDEIVVQGKASPKKIRAELKVLDLRLIELYNAENLDDRYDIKCGKVAPIGSQIKVRKCRFLIDMEDDYPVAALVTSGRRNKLKQRSREILLDLARTHKEIRLALIRRNELRTALKEAKGQ